MNVSPQFLMKGALYALEQCGLLLNDAVALSNQKSYSNSLVLAAFAREELGRCKILVDLFESKVREGKRVTIEDIDKQCRDHINKQSAAQLSISYSFKNDSTVGKQNLRRMELIASGRVDSDEYKDLEGRLNEIIELIKKRTPVDRHKAREAALYVEPDNTGVDWNLPKKISPEFAIQFVMYASNDYSLMRQRLEESDRSHPEFSEELSKWADRPTTSLPKWPDHPI